MEDDGTQGQPLEGLGHLGAHGPEAVPAQVRDGLGEGLAQTGQAQDALRKAMGIEDQRRLVPVRREGR